MSKYEFNIVHYVKKNFLGRNAKVLKLDVVKVYAQNEDEAKMKASLGIKDIVSMERVEL